MLDSLRSMTACTRRTRDYIVFKQITVKLTVVKSNTRQQYIGKSFTCAIPIRGLFMVYIALILNTKLAYFGLSIISFGIRFHTERVRGMKERRNLSDLHLGVSMVFGLLNEWEIVGRCLKGIIKSQRYFGDMELTILYSIKSEVASRRSDRVTHPSSYRRFDRFVVYRAPEHIIAA